MGPTLLCILGFILTDTILKSGQSEAAEVKATLRADNTTIPVGGRVVLTCSVESVSPSGWKYQWFRRTSGSTQEIPLSNVSISVTKGGDYWCKAGRTGSPAFTAISNVVPIYKLIPNRPIVNLEPNGTQIFRGETKTLRCEIHGSEDIKWEFEWMTPNPSTLSNSKEYKMGKVVASDIGDYRCRGIQRGDVYSSTEWSEMVTLTFYPKARVRISADKRDIPAGGSVTLTCSVSPPSPGWEYSWFKGRRVPEPLKPEDYVVLSSHQISIWKGGPYWCRASRGNPVYHTENTDYISLTQYIAKRAVSTIQPKWPRIYKEELITFMCDIEGEDYSEWDFEWRGRSSFKPPRERKVLTHAYAHYNGDYYCVGKRKNEPTTMTAWSKPVNLMVFDYVPKPTLAVSPSWLSPGDSVTLTCDIKNSNAGWRFYWYKAVPKLSDKSYSYELLPGSSSGTANNSYIVHGQTHTAGYVCQAGRGEQIYYTQYSDVKFVWSGDIQSASLTVSPNRVQHFTSDSITLSCKGSSAQWRVEATNDVNSWSHNSDCETMTGATCTVSRVQEANSVYWCESDTGEFSNAVNISADKKNIILVSPVHPVTEGDSFTLGCKLKTGKSDCTVVFLRDDKIIGNDSEVLKISAVSKSDEGFYKCKCGRIQSPQSWVAIRSQPQSSALVPGLVGLFLVIIVIVLLLLLCSYKKLKNSNFDGMCHILRKYQESAADQIIYQNESQQHVYSTLVHGDVSIYESIDPKTSGNGNNDDSMDVSVDYVNANSATGP